MFMFDFSNTRQTLKDLENDLRCSVCGSLAGSPCTLGGCEHIYCSACCEKLLGQSCVVCHIPVHVKDAQVNRQLFNLVNLCKRLGQILNNAGSNDSENIIEPEVENSATKSDAIPDVYDFVSPELSTPTKLSHKQEASRNNGKQKRRSRSSKIGEKLSNPCQESLPSNSTTTCNHDLTSNKSRGKALSPGVRRKTRSTEPEDQTTMTQFFDYMETNDETNIDNGSSAAANFSSADKSTENKSGEKSKKGKLIGESRFKMGKSKGSKILRVRKTQNNDEEDDEDLSLQKRDEGNVSKVNMSSNEQNSGDRSGPHEVFEVQEEERTSSRPSNHLKKAKRSVGACETTSSITVPSDNKKARRSVGAASTSIDRKKTRRSFPACLSTEDVSFTTQKSEKMTRISSHQQKNQDNLNSSLSGSGKGSHSLIDKKNAKGETPLQVACIKGDLEKVQSLLSSGANPNNRDNAGWTPLHEACHYGHVEIAERLITAGALIDVPGTENETPLHDAVRHLKVDCVKLLVQHGASVNARNIKGLSPVQLAGSNAELMSALETKAQDITTHTAVQVDPLSYQSPCFLSTGLSRDQKITLQKCATKLQAKVTEDFSHEVTHIVTSCNKNGLCPRTMKYLQGVLTGRWIVNMDWVEMCLEYGMKVCEEAFEIPGTSSDPESHSAQKGRVNRQQQLPGLFDGCQFYFSGNFEYPTPDKEELIDLVKLGGGHVIQREPKPGHIPETDLTIPYHAPAGMETCCIFIIHDNNCQFQPIRTPVITSVRASWVMDCISQFKLIKTTV
ncbi:BRCA1-associated RING domain protein 1-like [Saccostrea echinata]|uniref:BRCA1-associated RING domain protein 1-like n=1 Tax=Saccostrea echinata TaxID=191078 RepID=UPI002A7F0C1E|nr:BRCA1-associated RING domain protein 1-like [Saccostrea echinata]